MEDEKDTLLEERWQDYQLAMGKVIADLKADPANRHACFKAWVLYASKIALFSLSGSAVLLAAIFVTIPQLWAASSLGLVFNMWLGVSFLGPMLLPLIFPAPIRYWESRAAKILDDADIPPKHRAF